MHGKNQNFQPRKFRDNFLAQLDSIHARERDIDNSQVRFRFAKHLQRFFARAGLAAYDKTTSRTQQQVQTLPN
jgi:hypothetical protein